jgi:hypothetical protein
MKTPEQIIGVDAVLALSMAGYSIVPAEQFDLGPQDFAELWVIYPHKVAKVAAERAYKAARKRGVRRETILEGVKTYIATKPLDRPWLHLATFCNQERWNDLPAPVQQKGIAGVRQRIEQEIANGGLDPSDGHHDAAGGLPLLRLFDH